MKLIFLSLLVIIFILTIYNNTSTIDHFIDVPPDLSKTIDTINKEIELQSNKTNTTDLNKYILKTEIPVCPKQINIDDYIEKNKFPDMSKYILKTQLPICPKQINMDNYIEKNKFPDMSKYILKTQLPICPKQINIDNYIKKNKLPDMSKYILKTQLPICPKLPDISKFVLKSSIPPPKPVKCRRCPSLNDNTINSLSINNMHKTPCK